MPRVLSEARRFGLAPRYAALRPAREPSLPARVRQQVAHEVWKAGHSETALCQALSIKGLRNSAWDCLPVAVQDDTRVTEHGCGGRVSPADCASTPTCTGTSALSDVSCQPGTCAGAQLCILLHMRYEWDQSKNRANLSKHGVDFADAVAVFEDDFALTRQDPDVRGERRFVILALDGFGRHLVVVFTESSAQIRIISARLATKQERKTYEG